VQAAERQAQKHPASAAIPDRRNLAMLSTWIVSTGMFVFKQRVSWLAAKYFAMEYRIT
jgi:hypothetical protein